MGASLYISVYYTQGQGDVMSWMLMMLTLTTFTRNSCSPSEDRFAEVHRFNTRTHAHAPAALWCQLISQSCLMLDKHTTRFSSDSHPSHVSVLSYYLIGLLVQLLVHADSRVINTLFLSLLFYTPYFLTRIEIGTFILPSYY